MLKKTLITALFATCAISGINISGIESLEGSATFRDQVFNEKIKMPTGCITVKEAFDLISHSTNHTFSNETLIDKGAPVCNLDKYDTVGRVLEAVINDGNKVFFTEVRGSDYHIVLKNSSKYVVTFPLYWDTSASARLLKDKYPAIKWVFYGNVVKAEGAAEEIQKAKETLGELREYATRSIPTKVRVYELDITDEELYKSGMNMNRVNVMQRLPKEGAQEYVMQISHGNQAHVNGVPVAMMFDLQKNEVVFGDRTVPMDMLNEIAFIYNKKMITVDFGGLLQNRQ